MSNHDPAEVLARIRSYFGEAQASPEEPPLDEQGMAQAVEDVARFFEKGEPDGAKPTTPFADAPETQVEKDVAAYFQGHDTFDTWDRDARNHL